MNSIKNILVDICVTIFIAVTVWLRDPWMWWVIVVYTILMLIAKGFAVFSEGLLRRTQKVETGNEMFLHFLYVLNIVLLAVASWWYLAVLWLLIWLFSYFAQLKTDKATGKS